jgi:hypothetical protein
VIHVIQAPNDHNCDNPQSPIVFLAGPIVWAPEWQRRATDLLLTIGSTEGLSFDIANPRRKEWEPIQNEADADFQVRWETRYAPQFFINRREKEKRN